MIIRSLLRRPGGLQSLAAAPAKPVYLPSSRSIHTVPSLQNHPDLVEKGIPGLFSKKQFDIAYTQYQKRMVDELNITTSGTPLENHDVKSLIIDLARDPTNAYGFNVASMAFNNHFFFRGLATDSNVISSPSSDLVSAINNNFSSLDSFRETFLATADAMFGPGFLWLVQLNESTSVGRPLRILPTYIAGSPLSGAHYRRQSHDLNTENADTYQTLKPANSVGSFGTAANLKQSAKKPLGGVDVTPLLCVSTWEHTWLEDYGVNGKMDFLMNWWQKINWNVVQESAHLLPSGGSQGRSKFY